MEDMRKHLARNHMHLMEEGYASVDNPMTSMIQRRSRRITLNSSDNVLLAYRAASLKGLSGANFVAALLSLSYCALNMTLLYANLVNAHAKSMGLVPPVDKHTFHLSEFWGTFGFALVEIFALMQTPKSLIATVNSPRLLKIIVFLNVVFTLIPAILVTVNLEYFEVVSHELELK